MQEQSQLVLAEAGLPSDRLPLSPFDCRDLASEQQGEAGLKLIADIYERTAARSGSFLTAEELVRFDDFRTAGVGYLRSALAISRTMLAPTPN